MKPKHGIKNIHIEPADDGGFMTEVCHYPKEEKKSGNGKMPMPMDYDSNITKHVCSSGKELGEFISGLFPPVSSRSKKGKSESASGDGSSIETYEGDSEGGDVEEEE